MEPTTRIAKIQRAKESFAQRNRAKAGTITREKATEIFTKINECYETVARLCDGKTRGCHSLEYYLHRNHLQPDSVVTFREHSRDKSANVVEAACALCETDDGRLGLSCLDHGIECVTDLQAFVGRLYKTLGHRDYSFYWKVELLIDGKSIKKIESEEDAEYRRLQDEVFTVPGVYRLGGSPLYERRLRVTWDDDIAGKYFAGQEFSRIDFCREPYRPMFRQ